jgi:hypothetical protein
MTTTKQVFGFAGGILLLAVLVVGAGLLVYRFHERRAQAEALRRREDAANKLIQLTPEKLIGACGKPAKDEPSGDLRGPAIRPLPRDRVPRHFDAKNGRRLTADEEKKIFEEAENEEKKLKLLNADELKQLEKELWFVVLKGRDISYVDSHLDQLSDADRIRLQLLWKRTHFDQHDYPPTVLTFHFEEGKFSDVQGLNIAADAEWIIEVLPCIPFPQ